MKVQDINNFFGDMDLFLIDLILKGKVLPESKVLDIGCGEGRNGIYFIQNGFEYHGWDTDQSKLRLIEYMAKSISDSKAHFEAQNFLDAAPGLQFDFIISSRVLHFAESKEEFLKMWSKTSSLLKYEGIIYASLDSVVDVNIGKGQENGKVEFPDGKVRFALTSEIYEEIKKGFEEIEPLRTMVHHGERAQSFLCLKKS